MKIYKLFVTAVVASMLSFSLAACASSSDNNTSVPDATETPLAEGQTPTVSQDGESLLKIVDASFEKIKTSGYTEIVKLNGFEINPVGVIKAAEPNKMYVYDSTSGEYYALDEVNASALAILKEFVSEALGASYETSSDVTTVSLTDDDKNVMVYTATVKDGVIVNVTKTFNKVQEFEASISYSITAEGQKVLDNIK